MKAKEADKEMRDMARRARIEYKESLRRTNNMIQAAKAFGNSTSSPDNKPPIPPKSVSDLFHQSVTSLFYQSQ